MKNIPDVKLGMIAVSRDCFIVSLSRDRRINFASEVRKKGVDNLIIKNISRGKVDVFIRVKELESDAQIVADTKIAQSYSEAIKQVAKAIGYDENNIPLSLILSQTGVLNTNKNYDVQDYQKKIEPVFQNALEIFLSDAKREGENLKADLKQKLSKLEEYNNHARLINKKVEENNKKY